jgi:Na+-transporting NADH:ubiquinone oxidoreductase subunit NqrD
MRAYILTSGILFGLVAFMHLFITIEHFRMPATDAWLVIAPGAIFVISSSLAIWAWQLLTRKAAP